MIGLLNFVVNKHRGNDILLPKVQGLMSKPLFEKVGFILEVDSTPKDNKETTERSENTRLYIFKTKKRRRSK